jgi:DNA-binding MarR family transcriptional regulator
VGYQPSKLARLGDQLRSVPSELPAGAGKAPDQFEVVVSRNCFLTEDRAETARRIRSVLKARRQRANFFRADLFADPAWDMLLELYATLLCDRRICVSDLCEASDVPPTTALRWISKLETEGLLIRRGDPFDGRRVWVELSGGGLRAMDAYWGTTAAEAC